MKWQRLRGIVNMTDFLTLGGGEMNKRMILRDVAADQHARHVFQPEGQMTRSTQSIHHRM